MLVSGNLIYNEVVEIKLFGLDKYTAKSQFKARKLLNGGDEAGNSNNIDDSHDIDDSDSNEDGDYKNMK